MNDETIMNPTIEKMLLHASVRDFKAEPLSADVKELLIKAAQSGLHLIFYKLIQSLR